MIFEKQKKIFVNSIINSIVQNEFILEKDKSGLIDNMIYLTDSVMEDIEDHLENGKHPPFPIGKGKKLRFPVRDSYENWRKEKFDHLHTNEWNKLNVEMLIEIIPLMWGNITKVNYYLNFIKNNYVINQ